MAIDTAVKTQAHEFERLLLGLDDLKNIGRFFTTMEVETPSQLKLQISSTNEADTATFTDPELLSSHSLPKKIEQIKFSLQVNPDTYVELNLAEPFKKYATVTVSSNDEALGSRLLREIQAEVGNYQVWGKGLKAFAESITGCILSSVLCALSMLGAGVFVGYTFRLISNTYFVVDDIIVFAMFLAAMTLFGGGFIVNHALGRLIPPIEYTGELSEACSKTVTILEHFLLSQLLLVILIVPALVIVIIGMLVI